MAVDLYNKLKTSRGGLESYRQDLPNLENRFQEILRQKPDRIPEYYRNNVSLIKGVQGELDRLNCILDQAERHLSRFWEKRKAKELLVESYHGARGCFLGLHGTWQLIDKLHRGLSVPDDEWREMEKKRSVHNLIHNNNDITPILIAGGL